MSVLLKLAFLFFVGSVAGWVAELLFRRFISSANPERKWINPGFCTGPYLPIYGLGLCALYLIASAESLNAVKNPVWNRLMLFAFMAIAMTAIEYIAGILSVKLFKVRLWDYRGEWGNIQGIICPKFSLIWAAAGALYYFLINPYILGALSWLSRNLAFSFFIGLFFGVFIIDFAHSMQLITRLKRFAEENNVIVRYEGIKSEIRAHYEKTAQKYRFFRPFRTDLSLSEHLKNMTASFESRIKKSRRRSGGKNI